MVIGFLYREPSYNHGAFLLEKHMTVYAVGLIYNDEWEGEVIQHYSLWSNYDKAKEEALKQEVRFASAIVVQPFAVDNPNQFFDAEIIKSHISFVRYEC